ncbi:MAG: AsmA family protein [Alphaproteobacteria bacterium]|nr:AsmA family protein [Alphaproteobacteria bacterium]
MQTTLLSIAVALILALLAALVGPHVVRWNDHRAFFETEASRLVGVPVKVGGDIDAALLPFPSVTLRAISIGPAGEGRRMQSRLLRIELSLGSLMRGELRATEMRLVAPQFNIGLDSQGQIDWPTLSLANETLSIDRLRVEDGQATLTDATSKSRLVLDQLWFTGDVRSLTGPIRGKGEFVTGGGLYGYDISASRAGPEGTRLKFSLKTDERPLTLEADGFLAFERAVPRFDGALTLSRPAGVLTAGGKAVTLEPWKLTSKVKAGTSSALLDEVAFQYGPDERSATLTGAGEFKFGARPQLQGTLSARQVDLDRLLVTAETPRRLPLAAVQAFGELLGGALRPSWPVKLALNVDAMTLGGAVMQNVATDLRSDGETWTLDKLELRAPGFTQIKADGRLFMLGKGLGFAGAASIDSNDPKNLLAWMAGRSVAAAQYQPWRAKGDVTLRADRIAIERLRTEFGRGAVEGSVSYAWPTADRPARLDGELRAAELDLDGVYGFGESALSGLGLERPGEITLAMEVARAKLAGFDARDIAARLKLDAGGLAIERLSIGDLGDTSFVANGRIQTQASPGGSITVNLDARDLNGLATLSEKFTPVLAGPLRRLAARQKTAALQASISMTSSGADGASGKIGLTGKVGVIRVNVSATATGKREAFALTDLGALTGADVQIDGQFAADTAIPLLGLFGLERVAGVDGKPARLDVSASGPLGRELRIEGKLAAGPIDAGGKGTLRFAADQPAILAVDQFAGSIGGSKVQGRWALHFENALRIDGSLNAEDIDAPVAVATAIGAPARAAAATGWSTDPLAWGPTGLNGRIEFTAQRAVFAPWLVAQRLNGAVQFNGPEIVFENIAGDIGDGRLDARLAVSHGAGGVTARLRVGLADAELGTLIAAADRPATSGRLTLQTELEGVGRSPAAFIGSLTGFGSVTVEQARLVGLNPDVFGAVTRAVKLGIPIDGNRMLEFTTGALDNAGLPIAKASATISINAGQARLRDIAIRADGADLQATVNVDLADAMVDALLTLNAPPSAPGAVQPAVMVALKGSLPAPRRSVDTALLASWLTLRAVELQSRHLEAMERAAREAAAAAPLPMAEPADQAPAAAPLAVPERAPAGPAPHAGGTLGEVAVPLLPPPVAITPVPKPRAAPRADVATPPPPASPAPPARTPVQPPLLGSQN